jgi:hypothetical protein
VSILLTIFATIFIGDIALKIFFLLYLFGIMIMLASLKAPLTFNLQNTLERNAASSSSNVWWN